jgi:hypothetical protein
MVNRKREISLDDLNPLDLEPTPENVELVRRGLAKIDNNRLVWGGVLAAWERQLGLWTPPPSSLEAIRQPKGNPRPKLNGVPTKQLKLIQGSVTDAVYQILSDASRPMTFRDLEDALRKRGLGHKLLGEKKPHYGAIQRLCYARQFQKIHGCSRRRAYRRCLCASAKEQVGRSDCDVCGKPSQRSDHTGDDRSPEHAAGVCGRNEHVTRFLYLWRRRQTREARQTS